MYFPELKRLLIADTFPALHPGKVGKVLQEFNQSGDNGDGCDQHTTHAKGEIVFQT